MTRLPVSLAEISREGPWALRALGYSFFVADRATRMLVWTEAVHQLGLKFLRIGDPGIRLATSIRSSISREIVDGKRLVDAKGRCVLEVGPPAVDLATLDARTHGYGHVLITNVTGLCMADALSEIVLNRDLGFMFVYASGDQEIGTPSLSRSGWLAGLKQEGGAVMYGSELPQTALEGIEVLARFADRGADREQLVKDCNSALQMTSDGSGFLAISLFKVDPATATALAGEKTDSALPVVDYLERITDAQMHGVIADKADLAYLYELEHETWAPTSERSKMQAGF